MPAPPDPLTRPGLPTHAPIEAALAAALWQGTVPAGLTAPDPQEIARRFAVYRNNVAHGLSAALARRFPVVARLVGEDFFAAMARAFAAEHPPRDPRLMQWGAALPGFLQGFPPVAALPYLPDVARLEIARGTAYHAADADPMAPDRLAAALSGAAPESMRLGLHPSVTLLSSPWPIVGIWRANQAGADPQARARLRNASGEAALVARTPSFEVVVELLDAATHAVLSALAQGAPLGRAADGRDPTEALTLLLRHGLVTRCSADPGADPGPDVATGSDPIPHSEIMKGDAQ